MKNLYVSSLQDGQAFTSRFLVREKEIRTSARTGSSWLQLELADRTGTISAKMWDNFAAIAGTFERDDVVEIRGRVKLYNGQKELTLEAVVPSAERDYELADYLPHTKHDVEKMYSRLRVAVAEMQNPFLQKLLTGFIDDPAIATKLKRAPAAMTMHHAFIGGLLEHMVSLVGLARAIALHYPELDADLLLTGVVLHDIGKIDELRYTRGIEYTTEGRLLGHIMIGAGMVQERIKAIPGFPAPLAVLVEHLVLSHHGTHEFGSPALPQVREAVALNFIDDLDSKMAAMGATLDSIAGDEQWTGRNPSLRRQLLDGGKYLGGGAAKSAAVGNTKKKG